MSIKKILLSLFIAVLFIFQVFSEDTDWTKWRGPHGNSIYDSKAWTPAALKDKPPIVWKINVGKGYSAVSVRGSVFYTMGNDNKNDTVYCLEVKTGKKVWEYSYPCNPGDYNGPRVTPVIEGNFLYTLSREGHLFCINAENGKEIWKKHLVTDYGATPPTWGFAGTPQIEGDMLLINANTHGIAINKKDGKLIWSSPKGTGGYAAAVVYTQNKQANVAIFGQKALYGVDKVTGKKLWEFPWETDYDVNAADPLVVDNKVFISSDYGKGCALVDITNNAIKKIYENRLMASHFSSFVYKDGYIYGNSSEVGNSRAPLRCIEFSTGKLKWEAKLGSGSLIASNGFLLYFTERGKLYIAKLNSESYQEAASAQIMNGTCWTAPVLYIDKLFLRNDRGDVVCVNLGGK